MYCESGVQSKQVLDLGFKKWIETVTTSIRDYMYSKLNSTSSLAWS